MLSNLTDSGKAEPRGGPDKNSHNKLSCAETGNREERDTVNLVAKRMYVEDCVGREIGEEKR